MPVSVDPAANVYPIDVDLYMEIAESGALDGRRIELVDGVLVEMSPARDLHSWAVLEIGRHLVISLADHGDYRAGQQSSIAMDAYSVPEPDFMVIRVERFQSARDSLQARRPVSGPELVGEVSLTSRRWDLGRKRLLYAAAGVPEYWVLDLVNERMVVHRDPVGGDYETISVHRRGDPVAPRDLPVAPFDIAVALDLPT